jgi:8-oxo-dGTP pyrophosphatase MutT (NUDIX family)
MAVSLFLVGAAGVIVRERSVLLLKRSRHKDFAPGEWDLVSGRVESGESVPEALRREIGEECGLEVEILEPIETWRMQRNEHELIGVIYRCRYLGGKYDCPRSTRTTAGHRSRRSTRCRCRPAIAPRCIAPSSLRVGADSASMLHRSM